MPSWRLPPLRLPASATAKISRILLSFMASHSIYEGPDDPHQASLLAMRSVFYISRSGSITPGPRHAAPLASQADENGYPWLNQAQFGRALFSGVESTRSHKRRNAVNTRPHVVIVSRGQTLACLRSSPSQSQVPREWRQTRYRILQR